jgi:hypothetical protein
MRSPSEKMGFSSFISRIDLIVSGFRVMNGDAMNNTKRKQNTASATPGFAIPITPDTDLGNAVLIVEDEEGYYEPTAFAMTINEGREMAQDDLHSRQRLLEKDADPGLCPCEYKLWARGIDGTLRVAATWNVSEL